MHQILTSSQDIRTLDQYCINQLKIPGIVLMDQAGREAVKIIIQQEQLRPLDRILIVCGKGNNGGDGLIVAKYLHQLGHKIKILYTSNPDNYTGDAFLAWQTIKQLKNIEQEIWNKNFNANFSEYKLIVDAIFGTGFRGPLSEDLSVLISQLNLSKIKIAALDIPSGLSCDNFKLPPLYIKANYTITFGHAKTAQFHEPSKYAMGKLFVVDIGYPRESIQSIKANKFLLGDEILDQHIFHRHPYSNKGTYGKVLVIGGSHGMYGAPIISAWAALRAGAGLVFVMLPNKKAFASIIYPPEIMIQGLSEDDECFAPYHIDDLKVFCQSKQITAIAVGMGIGRKPETLKFVKKIIDEIDLPVVLDADGIHLFKQQIFFERQNPLIITPHAKEFSDCFGGNFLNDLENPIEFLQQLAQEKNLHIVHKSSTTTITTPNQMTFLNNSGTAKMASAGMGDCLAGMVVSMLAQQLDAMKACTTAVYWHGKVGEEIAKLEQIAVCATDVVKNLKK